MKQNICFPRSWLARAFRVICRWMNKDASFERRQAILKQFIKEVRVGRDYNIEIVLNVPLDEFEEFKRHAASARRGKNQKTSRKILKKLGVVHQMPESSF